MTASLAMVASCQRDHTPSASDAEIAIAKRDWQADEAILVAGEQAADCPRMAIAMQSQLAVHRNDLIAAKQQLANPDTIKLVTDYIEAHPAEFPDLDERWTAVSARCDHNPAVQAILREKSLDPGTAEALPTP